MGHIVGGQEIEVGRIIYPAGSDVKAHTLHNEQIHTIMKGKANFRIAGEERVVGPGEALLIRPYTEFSATILEEFEALRFKDVGPGKVKGLAGADVVSGFGEVGARHAVPLLIQHWVYIIDDYETVNCKNIVEGWSVYDAQWKKGPCKILQ